MSYIENPVFICGHRKGGTTMLLCLLDNHPELLVYPPDSAFFYAYYPPYDSDEYSPEQKIQRMIDRCIGGLEYEITKKLSPEDSKDLNFPMDKFREDFREVATGTKVTPADMLRSLMKAYRKHFKGSANAKHWVEKTTSTEIYAAEVKKWFPGAKFIHVLRDPRDNWASLRSGWDERYSERNDSLERLLQSMIDRGRLGLEFARVNPGIIGEDDYLVMRYEDIVTDPKPNLEKICEFLGIEYDDCLMTPTVAGKFWLGNNFEGKTFKGPDPSNVGRWKKRVPVEEAKLIEFHFADVMREFGYESEFSDEEKAAAATEHYKWFNFVQLFSELTVGGNE